MASISKDIRVDASAAAAWDALRDYGAVHERVVPGFVTDCRLDGDDRIVMFENGAVARERLVAVDDTRRRIAYTVVESPLGLQHHQASVEVLAAPDGDAGCLLRWTTDLLPDEAATVVEGMMEQGAVAMSRALAG